MKRIEQTLLEQMQITDLEIEYRKTLFDFSSSDAQHLRSCRSMIEKNIEAIVSEFYMHQTSIPEIALLIGDADTLTRLRGAQHHYILDLFSGLYDREYVNNRLRIGLVHKRIGVDPKLYLCAVHTLQTLLHRAIEQNSTNPMNAKLTMMALDKLLMFDVSLIFETYVGSLVSEIETAQAKSEQYARSLEAKVKERTRELEELSRTDALTGLLNMRHLNDILTTMLRAAQRRHEPVSVIYIDINEFKQINDTYGHQYGDEVLCVVAGIISEETRAEDKCFRYGGDEFCIVMTNSGEADANKLLVKRINKRIEEVLGDVTLSIGVAQTGPVEYVDATTIIQMADEKMFAAKYEHHNITHISNT
ncbi:GGDEF domain-containing protein [Salinivibrio sp. ES.052]|uniref:GGDEF domain-containing protein n=1 Tax=Salinivibrio sp. ES.052 TaxID=1882823 RepID=UPI000925BBFC|nr:GGDEF domain-containing protein [Salinivibrio sp. ES.052]SIO35168.1 diguanylate cyclase [Salinivibrio sp. ES.052]